jgi:translation initiation factor IF-3
MRAVVDNLKFPLWWVFLCAGRFASPHIFLCRHVPWQSPKPMNRRCITISVEKDNKIINEDIRLKEVRLVGPEDEQLGIMSSEAALRIAYEKGLDLVLMAPNAVPPVCRVMDYGKFRFDREKKVKEARKKQQVAEMKEVQLSCRIDTHDFETKARHAQTFLSKGNKVRVVMRFKGREMSHMAIGREIMDKFIESCAELGAPEKKPVLDGRSLSTVIAPVKQNAKDTSSKKKSEQADGEA